MSRENLAQLTHATIGRTRTVGRTKLGMPREETVPAIQGVIQYDRDGNRLHTNTHCHRAFVKHLDQHVKARVLADLLVEGFLEEGTCPYAPREALDRQPAVPPPEGFNAYCNGQGPVVDGIGGCSHLREVVKGRRAIAAERARLRKPPSAKQQDMNAVVVAVMAAMKGESASAPDEAAIRAAVEKVLNSTAPAPAATTPTAAVENPAAAAGKEALAAARKRTANTAGELG